MFPHRALLLILAVGFALRFAGLSWGVPGEHHFISWHPDEHRLVDPIARSLATGELTPPRYSYGCLLFDAVYASASILGIEPGGDSLHLLARTLVAVSGVLSIAAVYALGCAIGGRRVATIAATLFAVAPGHVMHSHFATADVPSTWFVAAALAIAVRAAGRPSMALALAGGVSAGLAAATKYPTGWVLVPVVVALSGSEPRDRARAIALAIGGAGIAFVAACPFLLTDSEAFFGDVYRELVVHPRTGHGELFAQTGNGWWYHLTFNLPWLLTWPFVACGVAGLFRLRARPGSVLLWFALPFFVGLGASQVRFMRYTLPLVPVLAVAAAVTLDWISTWLSERLRPSGRATAAGVAVACTAIVAAPAAFGSWQIVQSFRGTDPRQQASEWLERNLPDASSVGLVEVPGFRHPLLVPPKPPPIEDTSSAAARTWFLEAVRSGQSRYRYVFFPDWGTTGLLARRPEAVVISEFDSANALRIHDPEALAFFEALEAGWALDQRFDSLAPEHRWVFGSAPAPHDWLYPHPQIRVYRRLDQAERKAPTAAESRSGDPSR